jgi:hypothetical protein
MRLVHVNLLPNETYSYGNAYADRKQVEWRHFKHYKKNVVNLRLDQKFLRDTQTFPLVKNVESRDCVEVVVMHEADPQPRTIWKYGEVLFLNQSLRWLAERGCVIEIRMSNVKPFNADPPLAGFRYEDFMSGRVPAILPNTRPATAPATLVEPPEEPEEEDESMRCTVCKHARRQVVFKPCGHCNVCRRCFSRLKQQKCPFCRQAITEAVEIRAFTGKIIYSTADMHDVHSLLASLKRHFVQDDLLRQ